MSVYLISGLFALGGVALTCLLMVEASAFSRARPSRIARISDKIPAYSKAIYQVELVASAVAGWAEADDEQRSGRSHAFWDELVTAYQIQNEIRIMARTQDPADAMKHVLRIYRTAIENDTRKLPKPREQVASMINSFRVDLGLPPN